LTVAFVLGVFAVALLLPSPVRASIALQDPPIGITNSPLTSTSISRSFTVTAGANVLVVILLEKTATSTGITPATLTWNGLTLNRAVRTIDTAATYREAAVYYAYNPSAGTANITGTLTAAPVCTYLEAYTLSGADTNATPVTGSANSTSGTGSYLSFNVTVAANSWAAVGGVLGSKSVAGVAVTGTGASSSGVFLGNDTSADNCAFAFGYLSGLSGGLDTIAYSWTLPGNPNPTANAFVAAVFAPPAPPAFVKQPESLSLYSGGMVQFSAIVTGATSYQWLSNNLPLTGATNTTLAYGPGSANVVAGANYNLVATSANGSVTSSTVSVSLRTPVEPYEAAVANLGPYAFYQLNETASPASTAGGATAFDNANSLNGLYGADAQNGFNGVAGPTASTGFPGFTSINTALASINNDANSTVTLPSLNLNTNTVTFAAWIYPTIHEGTNVALVFCRGGGSGVVAGLNYSPNFNGSDYSLGYTWNSDQNTYNWDSQVYVPLNQWSLAALTVTPTDATIYLFNASGIVSSRHVYSHVVQTFNGTTLIGGDSAAASRTFLGDIDDVAVFNKALTRDQLSGMFYAASGVTNYAPTIATGPSSQSVFTGQSATFTVIGGGSQPLTYQWQSDTGSGFTNISNSGQFSGADTATLTIKGTTSGNAGNYQVILNNPWGTVPSSAASLTVNPSGAAMNITLSVQQAVGANWDTPGSWNDGQGGLPASVSAAEFPGSTYELLAGSRLRTPATNTISTFPGNQLTVDGSGIWSNNPVAGSPISEIRLKTQVMPINTYWTINFPRLIMNGGQIDNGPDGTPVGYVTIGGEIDINTNAPIYNDGAGGDNCGYNLTAWLTGSGTVEYHGDTTGSIPFNTLTNNLDISNPTNTFKGTWNIVSGVLLGSTSGTLGTNTIVIGSITQTNAALETTYDVNNPKGNLILYGQMFLHQNDTFGSVFIKGTPLAAGTYSFATLHANYPGYFPSSWALQSGSTVSNGSGSITVLINPAPIIVTQPQSVTEYLGQGPVSFSVTAAGTTPLGYQWFTNGTAALTDNGNRIGSTSNVLTIPNPTLVDSGNYTVVVTNIYGAVTSSVAVLTIQTPGPALNFTLDFGGTPIAQPIGAYWDAITNWNPNGQPASVSEYSNPGSTYEVVVGARLRTPNNTNYAAFPGDQLTVDGSGVFENATLNNVGELRLKHPPVVGTNYFKKLVMTGGQINNSGVDSPNVDTTADTAVVQGEMDILAPTPIYIESTASNDRSIQIASWLTGTGTILWHAFSGTLAGPSLQITGTSNTFSGQWIVDQGTLVGVGVGSLGTNGITVGADGLTAAVETLYDLNDTNASLTLGANGVMFLHQNDHFASVSINGTLLANGTYSFATLNSAYPANFPATWTLQNGSSVATGSGQIVIGNSPPSSPNFTGIAISGTSLSISATNGTAGGAWILLQSTNLTLPLSQWTTNGVGDFDGNGNLSTNIANIATNSQAFYILKVQ